MESTGIEFENLKATELRLGLPGTDDEQQPKRGIKRPLEEAKDIETQTESKSAAETEVAARPPPSKAQVVGWPPVRSYRKNMNSVQARKTEAEAAGGSFVKVGMDGAPYLRKIDLKMYKGYKELREALDNLFKCFSLEGNNGSDYAIAYEDKDEDWMLVGDVPWGMFTSSCKRLRIMRGSDARGLGSTS